MPEIMTGQPTPRLVSINKALLNLYFFRGDMLGGGMVD